MKELKRITAVFLLQWRIVAAAVVFTVAQCAAQLTLPRLMARVVNDGLIASNIAAIRGFGAQMLLVCLAMGLSGYLIHILSSAASQRFAAELRQTLYAKIQTLSPADVAAFGSGSLITRLVADVSICASLMSVFLRILLEPLLLTVGGTALVWQTDRRLGLVFLGFVALQMGLMLLFVRGTAPMFLRLREQMDGLNAALQALLSRLRLVKLMTAEQPEQSRFETLNDTLRTSALSIQKVVALFQPLVMLLVDLAVGAVLLCVTGTPGGLRPGSLLEIIAYTQQVLMSLVISGRLAQFFTEAEPSARRIDELLDACPSVAEGTKPIDAPVTCLEARSVVFSHPGAGKVLDVLSLTVGRGEFLALTGTVGCGKTTLAGLFARLHDPESGAVLLNGDDIKTFYLEDVRRHIALVQKQTVILSGTFWDNLIFGRGYVSREDAVKAAEAAQLASYVDSLPEGYETLVLSMGRSLSGGERQRLAIARALAGMPDILVLDDCTSALDYLTEDRLLQAIRRAYPEITIVMLTQRAMSAVKADRIAYLENGRVAQSGTAEELLRRCEPFRTLCLSRQGEVIG